MTDAERREKNRLRSERWRRAHGIMPRKPAQKPWLAMGISRSTFYRRKQACERAAQAAETNRQRLLLDRAEAFIRQLQRELAEAMRCNAVMARELGVGALPSPV